ncbi:MAG TPA: efflux RND transporter permease subunit [Nitratidesulfovibrio sp.]|nr:efflux RND transporter permease subunit [Nitratidesulfovibrio sp.]
MHDDFHSPPSASPNPTSPPAPPHGHGLLGAITGALVDSRLVPLLILGALLLGVAAILLTPSEEEPQIIVPMIDIHVRMPGATPAEVETRVVGPMEKLLWEIPGVEYVYSTSMDGEAMAIVRFKVGEDPERSLIRTYGKLYQHLDWIPPGCSQPLLKPRSIDDVPVMALTFSSATRGARDLRAVALLVNDAVRVLPGVAQTTIAGGLRREVAVQPDPQRLRAVGLDLAGLAQALGARNQAALAGEMVAGGHAFSVRLDGFLRTPHEVAETVVAVADGRPVLLRDVAAISDEQPEPDQYVFAAAGPAAHLKKIGLPPGRMLPAVTLSVAKRPGVNAHDLTLAVRKVVADRRGVDIPPDVEVLVTRDYGATAQAKADELLEHLLLAAVSVGGIVALFLGLRASAVVMVAVPVTLAVTLATYYLLGYTLNRVTLFALIFCIGILVDDPIVDVENIVRHLRLPGNGKRPLRTVVVEAVNEVRAPLVLATFTVIAAIMPMAFVGGLMGPYMRPMPVGASVAMLLSMAVAFGITPWTARHVLRPGGSEQGHGHGHGRGHGEGPEDWGTRQYRRLMGMLLHAPHRRWLFLGGVTALLVLACSLVPLRAVMVKMLPFDNKSEFQVVVDMPTGTPLEATARAAADMADVLLSMPEVTDCQVYAGTAAPFTFSGLIRHYYLRAGQEMADVQVNLADKKQRKTASHDIAKRARELLAPVAARHGARIKVVEVPPGPPVLQTLVAEIYGPDEAGRLRVAEQVKGVFAATPSVVDVDWYVSDPRREQRIVIEPDKAALAGVSPERARQVVQAAIGGVTTGLLHDPDAREDVPVVVRLPRERRAVPPDLAALHVSADAGRGGAQVPLSAFARIEERIQPRAIYHKNLQPVVYVTADMAGAEESPPYAMARIDAALRELGDKGEGAWQRHAGARLDTLYTRQPESQRGFSLKWDGEWQITYEVFRDMGVAFAAVMVLVYMLTVGWFGSYTTPIAIMSPIPLSLIGIIPAHAALGAFFTATSMIGFIAGAGIVVRNSIILVDFIELRRAEGAPLDVAVVEAGAVRFRPMLLTALSVVAGAFVILFDPIFQGLAISLLAGEVAATVFSRMVVPVLYYLDQHRRNPAGG